MTNRDMDEMVLSSENDSALARQMGVSRSTISRWRERPEIIPIGMYRKLAGLKSYQVQLKRIDKVYT